MARKGNGSSDKVVSAAALTVPTSYSYRFLYRSAAVPGASVVSEPFSVSSSGGFADLGFIWDHVDSTYQQSVVHRESTSGSYANAKFATALQADTWYAIGCVWDGASLVGYLNGVQDAVDATASTTLDPATGSLTLLSAQGGTALWAPGQVAEAAYWHNKALSPHEMRTLGFDGSPLDPRIVRPPSIFYRCLGITNAERDLGTMGNHGVVAGTTQSPHPYVAPRIPLLRAVPMISAVVTDAVTLLRPRRVLQAVNRGATR